MPMLTPHNQPYNDTYVGSMLALFDFIFNFNLKKITQSSDTAHVDNACDPQNFEPNLALNLEVADLVNSKKGNA